MNNTIGYYEQVAATRGAAARSEGATTGESKLTWIYRTIGLKEIADAVPINRESLKFIPFVESELNTLLTTNLDLKEDEYLYDGDGNAPIITGVKTVAAEFGAAAYAASDKFKFASANLFDLILAMVVDLESGKESKFKADFVLMNRGNSIAVKGEKNDFGSYLMPPFVTPDGKTIDGLRVFESSQVDLGTIIVGDSTKGKIYDGDGLEIQIGWINEQLLENAVTMRASRYMALVIKELDKAGFMKCTDIPTALTAIQKVVNG
jgi:HK97 family phage major capsid protein